MKPLFVTFRVASAHHASKSVWVLVFLLGSATHCFAIGDVFDLAAGVSGSVVPDGQQQPTDSDFTLSTPFLSYGGAGLLTINRDVIEAAVANQLNVNFESVDAPPSLGAFAAIVAAFATDGRTLANTPPQDFLQGNFTNALTLLVFQNDPVIYFNLELPNPSDETIEYFFTPTQELSALELMGDAELSIDLRVEDGNGDGASAMASGFALTSQEGSSPDVPLNTIIPIGDNFGAYEVTADDLNPGSFQRLVTDVEFGSSSSGPIIGQSLTIQVDVSPGDTAFVEGYFAVADSVNVLPGDDLVAAIDLTLDNTLVLAKELLAIPEPSTAALLLTLLTTQASRRRRLAGRAIWELP